MAIYSYDRYTSTGQASFAITFDYLSSTHIEIYLDGVLQTTGYSVDTGTNQVTFTSAPGSGVVVLVQRVTPKTKADYQAQIADFANGSVLSESDLDNAVLGLLYITQEAEDSGTTNAISKDLADNVWDAESIRIKNVATPTGSADAVTKTYVDGLELYNSPVVPQLYSFTATASQTAFTLSPAPTSTDVKSFIVDLDGVVQKPTTDFTVSGSTLTLTSGASLAQVLTVRNIGITRDILGDNPTVTGDLTVTGAISGTMSSGNVTSTGSTTARSLATRFAEVVNVKDYGAVGDGSTDDTTAIQAAITAASGGILYFPPSSTSYLQNGTLTYTCSVSGYGATVKDSGAYNTGGHTDAVIKTSGISGAFIEGITVDADFNRPGFSASSADWTTYRDCSATNCAEHGFNAFGADNVLYTRCKADGVKYEQASGSNTGPADGFYLGGCIEASFVECYANDFRRIGFVSEGDGATKSKRIRYSGCLATNGNNCDDSATEFNAGFWIENTDGVMLDNCIVTDMAGNTGQTSDRVRGINLCGSGTSEGLLHVLRDSLIQGDDELLNGITLSAGGTGEEQIIIEGVKIIGCHVGISSAGNLGELTISNVTFHDMNYQAGSHGGILLEESSPTENIYINNIKESSPTYGTGCEDAATIQIYSLASGGNIIIDSCYGITMTTRNTPDSFNITNSEIQIKTTSYGSLRADFLKMVNTKVSFLAGSYLNQFYTSGSAVINNCEFIGTALASNKVDIPRGASTIISNTIFKDVVLQWFPQTDNVNLLVSGCIWDNDDISGECILTGYYENTGEVFIVRGCTFSDSGTPAASIVKNTYSPDTVILQNNAHTNSTLTTLTTTDSTANVNF